MPHQLIKPVTAVTLKNQVNAAEALRKPNLADTEWPIQWIRNIPVNRDENAGKSDSGREKDGPDMRPK